MIRKYLLPVLALAGFCFAVSVVVRGSKPVPAASPVVEPPQSPYKTFVAGSGIIEANTENIAIAPQIAGVVTKVNVAIGDRVKAGDPLFTIDDRAARATLAQRRAAVQVAEASSTQAKNMLALADNLTDKRAMSVQDITTRRDDVTVAEAKLAQAKADLLVAETDLDRLTVRAPVNGEVMQLKIHVGEYAPTGVLAQPLILLGNTEPICVRVNVDENDAWRVKAGAAATGFLRGNKSIRTPLKFVRFEPYVVPKMSLTGDSTERVDTRVLQIIYSFDRGDMPIFVGQQMDVYIEAPGHNEGDKS